MTGAAERLAKIGEAVARLNVVGQEEGWSGHVHVAIYVADLSFVLACLRDAEQRAVRLAAEAQHWAERCVAKVDEREAAEARAALAEAALERVRALHVKFVCGCGEDHGIGCDECRLGADWPCPTMAALTASADDGGEG